MKRTPLEKEREMRTAKEMLILMTIEKRYAKESSTAKEKARPWRTMKRRMRPRPKEKDLLE